MPFVRIADLREGLIDKRSTTYISREEHGRHHKTALGYGDLVLSKTAYSAAAMVNVKECNVSQDIIAVRLTRRARERFTPGFVAAFLNSAPGEQLMARRFQGNVQQHLSLDDARQIRVPRLRFEFQLRVHELLEEADALRDESRERRRKAEHTLLAAMGLEGWQPEENTIQTANYRDVVSARRLDAKYHSSKSQELVERMEFSGVPLTTIGECCERSVRGVQPEYVADGDVPVVNSRHILESGIDYDGLERTDTAWLERNPRARLESGDVLTYATGAKIGRTAHFVMDGVAAASNHVNILRLRTGNPVYVAIVMNSLIGRFQTERHMSGSAQPELYPSDVERFVIPLAAEGIQNRIARQVRESEEFAVRARQILNAAKRGIEYAVDRGVRVGMAYLDEQLLAPDGPSKQ